jgi:hypothetical protein
VISRNDEHTLTEGNVSGAALELLRKALANKYPAAVKSFQDPSSSLAKNVRTASISLFSNALRNPTNPTTPLDTRLLYRCFAYKCIIEKIKKSMQTIRQNIRAVNIPQSETEVYAI